MRVARVELMSFVVARVELMSFVVARVELMCQIESVLLGDPFHFLTNFPPSRLAR